MKVAILTFENGIRSIFTEWLIEAGHQVITFLDDQPDLVILATYQLNDYDIASIKSYKRFPVVVLYAKAEPNHITQAIEAGAKKVQYREVDKDFLIQLIKGV